MFHAITQDDVYRIETQRLWLRWPKLADASAIATYVSDYAVAKMTARIPHPYPPSEAENFVFRTRKANSDGAGVGLVITPNSRPHEAVGAIFLNPTEADGELEIGYWIGVPFWGRGYASEAVAAMIQTGFGLSSANKVIGSVRTNNPASKRVLERNGFFYSHESTPFMPARGESHPVHWFALERANWLARNPSVHSADTDWSTAIAAS